MKNDPAQTLSSSATDAGSPASRAVLTRADLSNFRYYWNEYEDLERSGQWEDKLPALREECPELVAAWETYKAALDAMNRAAEKLPFSAE